MGGGSIDSDSILSIHCLVLVLPDSLTGVSKHYEDFIRYDKASTYPCEGIDAEAMGNIVVPGLSVKVKFKEKVVPVIVVECYYISKLSFDHFYICSSKG